MYKIWDTKKLFKLLFWNTELGKMIFITFIYIIFISLTYASDLPEPRIVIIGQTGSGKYRKCRN